MLPTVACDGRNANMKAILLFRDRQEFPKDDAVAELVVWQLPRKLPGSLHSCKYRLAFVVSGVCILRYDNEAGKGDHKHVGDHEEAYEFVDTDKLLEDFYTDVQKWRATR
jgi:Family of unknown function (DUF6516)